MEGPIWGGVGSNGSKETYILDVGYIFLFGFYVNKPLTPKWNTKVDVNSITKISYVFISLGIPGDPTMEILIQALPVMGQQRSPYFDWNLMQHTSTWNPSTLALEHWNTDTCSSNTVTLVVSEQWHADTCGPRTMEHWHLWPQNNGTLTLVVQ